MPSPEAPPPPEPVTHGSPLARRRYLALPVHERLRLGVAFCRLALRTLGAARRG